MKANNFIIQELVPEHIYEKRGEKAWELIDDRLIETLNTIKKRFPAGTATINNWFWRGNREWSGLRTTESKWFSETSQHAFGRAADIIFSEYLAEEVRQDIINNPDIYPHVKGIETGITWLHIDVRNTIDDKVKIFRP